MLRRNMEVPPLFVISERPSVDYARMLRRATHADRLKNTFKPESS
jgi:hypothetical protein